MTYYEKKRRALGLSQSEVANYLGISYKRYALIGRGKVKMPANLIDKFNELINKSKGERDIDRLNREEIVNNWWSKMSQKVGYGKYKINEKMKEFNIDTLKELAHLLGYKNQSQLCNYLSGKWEPTFNTKNMIYSFFEDELNIQPPKEKITKTIKRLKPKYKERTNLTPYEIDTLYSWYETFDIKAWVENNIQRINDMAKDISVAPNTIRALMRKEQPRPTTLKKVYDYIMAYDNKEKETVEVTTVTDKEPQVIEYTLEPVPEEEVPQEIKDSTQEIINEMNKMDGEEKMLNKLTNIYEEKLDTLNINIEFERKSIAELEEHLVEKKKILEQMIIKKDIYEELVDTINNEMTGE